MAKASTPVARLNVRLRRFFVAFVALAALLAPALGVGTVATVSAAVEQQARANCDANTTFFGLVPWYKYLTLEYDANTKSCRITSFDEKTSSEKVDAGCVDTAEKKCERMSSFLSSTSPVLLIALAILEDLIRVAGLVAVGFVIYGGIQYITSQGSPDDTKRAQQTIINALIGLVVALMAVGIVSFIGAQLGG
ncbi:hypothetical protein EYC59_00370 [Candidatus Saccharibacteria bacterium]|nr:MAG: hypothetical protein EYC59_00370 [Candidatus Saccharibacteria bacterium]